MSLAVYPPHPIPPPLIMYAKSEKYCNFLNPCFVNFQHCVTTHLLSKQRLEGLEALRRESVKQR